MAVHTPNVYSSVVSFCAATTAQRPMTREMMSLSCSGDVSSEGFRGYTRRRTMWKASAVRAREWARKPTMSSRRKKAVSIMSITLMRVLLDHAHLEEPAMTRAKSARARACGRVQGEESCGGNGDGNSVVNAMRRSRRCLRGGGLAGCRGCVRLRDGRWHVVEGRWRERKTSRRGFWKKQSSANNLEIQGRRVVARWGPWLRKGPGPALEPTASYYQSANASRAATAGLRF